MELNREDLLTTFGIIGLFFSLLTNVWFSFSVHGRTWLLVKRG